MNRTTKHKIVSLKRQQHENHTRTQIQQQFLQQIQQHFLQQTQQQSSQKTGILFQTKIISMEQF